MLHLRSRNQIGCAYRVSSHLVELPDKSGCYPDYGLLFDRGLIASMAPAISVMLSRPVFATVFPDWRGLCLFSEERWERLRQLFEGLSSLDSEARRLQRLALGHLVTIEPECPFIVPVTLQHYAHLSGEDILIVYHQDCFEFWSDRNVMNPVSTDADQ